MPDSRPYVDQPHGPREIARDMAKLKDADVLHLLRNGTATQRERAAIELRKRGKLNVR